MFFDRLGFPYSFFFFHFFPFFHVGLSPVHIPTLYFSPLYCSALQDPLLVSRRRGNLFASKWKGNKIAATAHPSRSLSAPVLFRKLIFHLHPFSTGGWGGCAMPFWRDRNPRASHILVYVCIFDDYDLIRCWHLQQEMSEEKKKKKSNIWN